MRALILDLGDDSPIHKLIAANANQPKQSSHDYYAGGVRIMRDGVPCRVAGWFKDLTKHGQSLIRGADRISPSDWTARYAECRYYSPSRASED